MYSVSKLTIGAWPKLWHYIPDTDVDDSKETLVLLLKLLLVKDLDREDSIFVCTTVTY